MEPARNIDVVRGALRAYNARDFEACLRLLAPTAVLDWSRSLGALRGVYHGHEGFRALWDEYNAVFDNVEIVPERFIDAGADVVVPNRGLVRGRDGIEARADSVLIYRVENGLITRLWIYQDLQDALRGPR